jgi:RNA polymerase sigma-70 factor (ECF subfamily)
LLDERIREGVEPIVDDEVLAERAKRDPDVFGVLYDRYVDRVYGYCRRRLETREEAEDATSLVFTRALAAMPRWRLGNGSFAAWLFAIARNVVIDQSRAEARRRQRRGFWEIDASRGPEESAEAFEAAAELKAKVRQLSADQADVVELRLAGLDDREIAGVLGKSHGAVRIAQHRAIKRLRALFGESERG